MLHEGGLGVTAVGARCRLEVLPLRTLICGVVKPLVTFLIERTTFDILGAERRNLQVVQGEVGVGVWRSSWLGEEEDEVR